MRTLFITDTEESAIRAGFDPERKHHRMALSSTGVDISGHPRDAFIFGARVWWPRRGFTLQDADLIRHTIWDVVIVCADIDRNMTWQEREQFRELVAVYLMRDSRTLILSF